MRTEAPLLAPVFRSEGQARLLATLVLTGDELSLTDLAERSDVAYATAHREVARLLDAGILAERQVGRTRLVSANAESPLVEPLREILLITAGPAALLAEALAEVEGVDFAVLYGSYAARAQGVKGPAPQDIDLMVIGRPNPEKIYAVCDQVEPQVGRPINPTILSQAEFGEESGFLSHIADNPTVPIIGEVPWQ